MYQLPTGFEESIFDEVETDAVHPRLAGGGVPTKPAFLVDYEYQCYDCVLDFHSLTELLNHCSKEPSHCSERCLKCGDSVLVYRHCAQTVRLHTCRRALLRHQPADLCLLAGHLSARLSKYFNASSVILCGECDSVFALSDTGVADFLGHSNSNKHNAEKSCRKCSMPEFKLITSDTVCCDAHLCTKNYKPTIKIIQHD